MAASPKVRRRAGDGCPAKSGAGERYGAPAGGWIEPWKVDR